MKEMLETFFKTTEDRLKNPFIGAFISSWLVFNWKSVLLLLFSSKIIEEKIITIEGNLSNYLTALVFPLISALFYTLLLPYINLGIDMLNKYSRIQRENALIAQKRKLIEDESILEIDKIKLEEAKTEFRERKKGNNLLEELQIKVALYEEEIESIRITHSKEVLELKEALGSIRDSALSAEIKLNDAINEKEILISEIKDKNSIIVSIQDVLGANQREYESLKSAINSKEQEIKNLLTQVEILEVSNRKLYKDQTDSKLNKINNEDAKVLFKFENGIELYEKVIEGKMAFVDINSNKIYSEFDFSDLAKKVKYEKYIK